MFDGKPDLIARLAVFGFRPSFGLRSFGLRISRTTCLLQQVLVTSKSLVHPALASAFEPGPEERSAARYSVGGMPTCRLKTLLKRGIEPKPEAKTTSEIRELR